MKWYDISKRVWEQYFKCVRSFWRHLKLEKGQMAEASTDLWTHETRGCCWAVVLTRSSGGTSTLPLCDFTPSQPMQKITLELPCKNSCLVTSAAVLNWCHNGKICCTRWLFILKFKLYSLNRLCFLNRHFCFSTPLVSSFQLLAARLQTDLNRFGS